MIKILAFAGSARTESFNKKLIRIAAAGAQAAGAEVTLIDLAEFTMPLFDQDLEAREGMPPAAQQFRNLMIEHDGFIIASPEYNSAFTPLLKNTLDWASRATPEDARPLVAFRGKYAAIMATSPGGLGGLRGLVMLRMVLGNIGVTVIPDQQAVPFAGKAFTATGALKDEQRHAAISALGATLTDTLVRINPAKIPLL